MATVRAPLGALQRIPIDINGQPTLPGLTISPSDQLEFFNGSPFPVSIQFVCANGPVFNNIARISSGATSSPQTPQKSQITTDYMITDLNTGVSQGPYSVEVGINTLIVPAPMLIPVSAGVPAPSEATVSIPLNGWVQFNLADGAYTIDWTPAGVFPSGPFPQGMTTPAKAQTGNQILDASYTLDGPRGVTGGGTVKIRS
jgi:hypothetical protein